MAAMKIVRDIMMFLLSERIRFAVSVRKMAQSQFFFVHFLRGCMICFIFVFSAGQLCIVLLTQ